MHRELTFYNWIKDRAEQIGWDHGGEGSLPESPCNYGFSSRWPKGQEEFAVEISGTTVTITCPSSGEDIKWKPDPALGDNNKYIIQNHDSSPLTVSCTAGDEEHTMYLNAKGE